MHELQFADSIRPAKTKILGLQMAHYSVGHDLLLLNQKNPLALLNDAGFNQLSIKEQCAAIIQAVLICCRNWNKNQKAHKWLGLWRFKNRNADYSLAIEDFRNYREAGSSGPETESVGGSHRALGAPFHAALIQFLIQKMGASECQAYDYPMGLAKFHYYTHAEFEGGIKIPNRAEIEFDEYCKREDEKAAKEKEAKCPASSQ